MKTPWCHRIALLCFFISLLASGRLQINGHASASLASIPWEDMAKQLNEQQRYGLAIVLPDSGNHQTILQACMRFTQSDAYGIKEMLTVPTWFCIDRQELKKAVRDLTIKENVLLLNAQGERIASTYVEWALDESAEEIRKLLFDPKGQLVKWAEASLTSTGEAADRVRQALAGLDADQSKVRRDARNLLKEHLPQILPALVLEHQRTTSIEVRESCRTLIEKRFEADRNIQGFQAGNTQVEIFDGFDGNLRGNIRIDF